MKRFLCAIVIAALIVVTGCKNSNDTAGQKVAVTPITLKDTTCAVDYSYPATMRGVQDVAIYPQVNGRILKINVKEGQYVRKGTCLFKIDDVSYRAAYDAAVAEQAVAQAQVETAKLTEESKLRLLNKNVISEYQYKVAKNSLMTAEANLARAKAAVESAANELSFTNVVAPVDGVIGSLPYKIGSLVGPSIPTPLTYVSDNSEIYADFSIQENTYLEIRKSLEEKKNASYNVPFALIANNGERFKYTGKLHSMSGMISRETGALPVIAIFPNPDRFLISGGSCRVLLSVEEAQAILLPRSSIKEIQNKMFVFRINSDSTLSQIEVAASRYNSSLWMLEPLEDGTFPIKAGDRITSTVNRLTDGMQVEVK